MPQSPNSPPRFTVAKLIAGLVLATIGGLIYLSHWSPAPAPAPIDTPSVQAHEKQLEAIKEQVSTLDETVWANEIEAQAHEDTLVALWDTLRPSKDKFATLREFLPDSLRIGRQPLTENLQQGISVIHFQDSEVLDRDRQNGWFSSLEKQGFKLVQSEWHHQEFYPNGDKSASSVVSMTLHVTHGATQTRYIVSGKLKVTWSAEKDARGLYKAVDVDASEVTLTQRSGPPVFQELTGNSLPEIPMGNDSVITYDLDRDGLSEIILPEQNTLWRNLGKGQFREETLCAQPAFQPEAGGKWVGAALISDFTGDGNPDLVLAGHQIKVVLFPGDSKGRFNSAPQVLFAPNYTLNYPSVITSGDINGDGWLDMFIAQIRPAYDNGSMPKPYYDANDGYPSYLLLNNGDGTFREAIEDSGLGEKRWRRTFSSSLVDLDGDDDLDLMVVSDFAGLDLHYNDGKGHFTDVTGTAVDEKSNFGMGHTLGDYDRDGRLDFYVTGMSSTTARRLEQMNLSRDDAPEIAQARMKMGYGSRMYLADGHGHFHHPAWKNQVARSGWSWGTSSFDLSNDGFLDIYVANGNISGKSSKDYCTKFWTRDIYIADSKPNPAMRMFFQEESERTREQSWNGYEKNAFFMNMGGTNFLNVGFLMDLAFEFDSRALINEDLDNDGQVDLVLLEKYPDVGMVASIAGNSGGHETLGNLHIYRNQWENPGNWVGVRLEDLPGLSPVGAKIRVKTAEAAFVAQILNGDSFSSQHSNKKHFGLGNIGEIEEIEVRWTNGTKAHLIRPAINQYYLIKPNENDTASTGATAIR